MDAIYSELALAGLDRLFPDRARQEGIRLSINWKLTRDPGFQSWPCETIAGRSLRIGRLFAGTEFRILFEVTDRLYVWSIGEADSDLRPTR